MKTAVFYGRYSTANQSEQSIEGQRHVCERFAAEHDILIVGEVHRPRIVGHVRYGARMRIYPLGG